MAKIAMHHPPGLSEDAFADWLRENKLVLIPVESHSAASEEAADVRAKVRDALDPLTKMFEQAHPDSTVRQSLDRLQHIARDC